MNAIVGQINSTLVSPGKSTQGNPQSNKLANAAKREARALVAQETLNKRLRAVYTQQCRRADDNSVDGHPAPLSVEYTREQFILWALERVGKPCPYCGIVLTMAKWTARKSHVAFDHRLPVVRGGKYELANMQVLCKPCNERKGILSGLEYCCLLTYLSAENELVSRDILARLRAGGKRHA